jgi:hypothetical protein
MLTKVHHAKFDSATRVIRAHSNLYQVAPHEHLAAMSVCGNEFICSFSPEADSTSTTRIGAVAATRAESSQSVFSTGGAYSDHTHHNHTDPKRMVKICMFECGLD